MATRPRAPTSPLSLRLPDGGAITFLLQVPAPSPPHCPTSPLNAPAPHHFAPPPRRADSVLSSSAPTTTVRRTRHASVPTCSPPGRPALCPDLVDLDASCDSRRNNRPYPRLAMDSAVMDATTTIPVHGNANMGGATRARRPSNPTVHWHLAAAYAHPHAHQQHHHQQQHHHFHQQQQQHHQQFHQYQQQHQRRPSHPSPRSTPPRQQQQPQHQHYQLHHHQQQQQSHHHHHHGHHGHHLHCTPPPHHRHTSYVQQQPTSSTPHRAAGYADASHAAGMPHLPCPPRTDASNTYFAPHPMHAQPPQPAPTHHYHAFPHPAHVLIPPPATLIMFDRHGGHRAVPIAHAHMFPHHVPGAIKSSTSRAAAPPTSPVSAVAPGMALAGSPWFEDDEVVADTMAVDAHVGAVESVEAGIVYPSVPSLTDVDVARHQAADMIPRTPIKAAIDSTGATFSILTMTEDADPPRATAFCAPCTAHLAEFSHRWDANPDNYALLRMRLCTACHPLLRDVTGVAEDDTASMDPSAFHRAWQFATAVKADVFLASNAGKGPTTSSGVEDATGSIFDDVMHGAARVAETAWTSLASALAVPVVAPTMSPRSDSMFSLLPSSECAGKDRSWDHLKPVGRFGETMSPLATPPLDDAWDEADAWRQLGFPTPEWAVIPTPTAEKDAILTPCSAVHGSGALCLDTSDRDTDVSTASWTGTDAMHTATATPSSSTDSSIAPIHLTYRASTAQHPAPTTAAAAAPVIKLKLNLRRAREHGGWMTPEPADNETDSDASLAGPAPKKRRSAAAALGAAAAKRKGVPAPPSPSLTASSTSGMSDRSTPVPMPLVPAHSHQHHLHSETTAAPEKHVPCSADYGARVARPTMYEQLTARGVPWCRFCGVTESPNWRQGPWGKKSLCNKHGCAWSGIAGNKRIRLDLRGYVEETLEDRIIPVVQDYCWLCQGKEQREVAHDLQRCGGCQKAFHATCLRTAGPPRAGATRWFCSVSCSLRTVGNLVIEDEAPPVPNPLTQVSFPVGKRPGATAGPGSASRKRKRNGGAAAQS
ncbi:hypothetical protein AMAG_07057 [Allomyces macrogynus ATCC 38327]|uniref:Zinc finger PHD-type domain-containing protein n=1 Tax=Allomyces macrogynus (strain ATCC 38327) TaxID=578462 RepID=A0A0L0SFP3_ALLM3|nr:hypothetical protein AMAG_07057 [Allomyces macrogynus ATCC 38327]|eukprot:KNE61321.1 hypothetical protein AMAG_07057 [Allomyces macrogynus ATCC 38327]